MPSLQFYNPDVKMEVERTRDVGGPATMTIEFGMSTTSYPGVHDRILKKDYE